MFSLRSCPTPQIWLNATTPSWPSSRSSGWRSRAICTPAPLKCQDDGQAAELGANFHKVARAVRQTLALEARLKRDALRTEREVRADAERQVGLRQHRKREQVRLAVERATGAETESRESERLLDELDDCLEEASLDDAFADDAVEAHVRRICTQPGVSPPAMMAYAPEAPAAGNWLPPAEDVRELNNLGAVTLQFDGAPDWRNTG